MNGQQSTAFLIERDARVRILLEENKKLKADAERLNFIANNVFRECGEDRWLWVIGGRTPHFRDAIDAAMKEQKC